jgi:PhnB protein
MYLHFNGNCTDALKFYAAATGGKIIAMQTYGESPAAAQSAPEFHDKVIHAQIQIGDTVIMASDAPPDRYFPPQGFSVSISADNSPDAERMFQALSEGGQVGMPMSESFFAHRFGMLTDKFGVPWMVIHQKPMGG